MSGRASLPVRFHIGLQRAASTYFYSLLATHPEVAMARKGLGFYANKFDRGMEWYRAQFPPDGVRIESSPIYFVRGATVAPRIRAALAEEPPRFFLMLRNPIDYTASRFMLHRRTKGLRKRFGATPRTLEDLVAGHPEYLAESRFAELLERYWLAQFDRGRFHIVLFEDFVRDQARVAAGVLAFFGLRPVPLAAVPSSRNATLRHPVLHSVKAAIVARPRLHALMRSSAVVQRLYERILVARTPKLTPSRRTWLADLLADDVARLKTLLGDPLTSWADFR
ncbi:MAG TPA: sulfotransferase domain-containing protein [bacterium]